MRWGRRPVAREFFLLQLASLLVVVALAAAILAWSSRTTQLDRARVRTTVVAETVAQAPVVAEALAAGAPSAELQAFADRTQDRTGTDFVVVMSPDLVRLTHPDRQRVGETYLGNVTGVLDGGIHTEEYTGTLGRSVRTVVPVRDDGRIVGMVSVGIDVGKVTAAIPGQLVVILGLSLVLAAVGGVQAVYLSRRLRHQTHGMDAAELGRMYDYHQSVLHAVREGLMLLDDDARVRLVNDEAARLLGFDASPVGRGLDELGLPRSLADALREGTLGTDEVFVVGGRDLILNQRSTSTGGEARGSVVTLRDETELRAVTGEVATVRRLAEGLRGRAHEASNTLHTVVSLIELGHVDQARDFAAGQLGEPRRGMVPVLWSQEAPVLEATVLGAGARAAELGVELVVDADSVVTGAPMPAGDLVTLVGNLLDNAIEATAGTETARIELLVDSDREHLVLEVEDSGPGVAPQLRQDVFARGWTTKPDAAEHGIGLAMVAQVVARHGGRVECASSELGGAAFLVQVGVQP